MDFLDENIQQGIKKGLRSMTHILYNEMYIYVWFICIYHVILVIIVLTNLVLLVKVSSRSSAFTSMPTFLFNSSDLLKSHLSSYSSPLETLDLSDFDHQISGILSST